MAPPDVNVFLLFALQWETTAMTTPCGACSLCSWPVGRPFARITWSPPCALSTFTLSCATSCPSALCPTTAPSQTLRICCSQIWLCPHPRPRPRPRPAPLPGSTNTPIRPWWAPSSAWSWCWAFWCSTSDKWRSNSCPHWNTEAGRCHSPYCKRTCICSRRNREDGRYKRRGDISPQGSTLCPEAHPARLPHTGDHHCAGVLSGGAQENLICISFCSCVRENVSAVLLVQA